MARWKADLGAEPSSGAMGTLRSSAKLFPMHAMTSICRTVGHGPSNRPKGRHFRLVNDLRSTRRSLDDDVRKSHSITEGWGFLTIRDHSVGMVLGECSAPTGRERHAGAAGDPAFHIREVGFRCFQWGPWGLTSPIWLQMGIEATGMRVPGALVTGASGDVGSQGWRIQSISAS